MKRFIRTVLHSAGCDVVPYSGRYFFNRRRAELLAELRADVVVDVGANAGQFGRMLRRDGYRGRIVSFEPLPTPFAELATAADANWETHACALGDRVGNVEMNVAGNSWSSSVLDMAPLHRSAAPDSAYVSQHQVEIRTLDSFGLRGRLYLKIDVQGYELDVLRGAAETLENCVAVETELSIAPLYEGQAPLADVIDALTGADFQLAGVAPEFVDSRTGEILQINVVFGRLRPTTEGGTRGCGTPDA